MIAPEVRTRRAAWDWKQREAERRERIVVIILVVKSHLQLS